jgi:hypothetical protein
MSLHCFVPEYFVCWHLQIQYIPSPIFSSNFSWPHSGNVDLLWALLHLVEVCNYVDASLAHTDSIFEILRLGSRKVVLFDTSTMHRSTDTNQSLSFSSPSSQEGPHAWMRDAIFPSYNFGPEDGSSSFSRSVGTQSTFIRCSNPRTGLILHKTKVLCSIWLRQL